MAFDEDKHGNWHHLLPSSRIAEFLKNIPRPWNKTKKRIKKHKAWHYLFRNKLPCEAIQMIESDRVRRYYKNKRGARRQKLLARENKWKILFGDAPKDTAIKIIKQEWMPCVYRYNAKGAVKLFLCFRFKQCFSNDPSKTCPLLYITSISKKGEITWLDFNK